MNEAIRQVTHVQNIRYDKATERLYIIDQTLLPLSLIHISEPTRR